MVCDEDYTGEYIIPIHNDSNLTRYISANERIGQVIFIPYTNEELQEVDTLEKTERGDNGFGSTGTK